MVSLAGRVLGMGRSARA